MTSMVRLESIRKSFGGTEVLKGIDLDVPAGSVTCIIGPSGCGKSTLLRLIADLDQPSTGTVEVFGKPASAARVDQDYGIAFQQAGLLPWRTVAENVALPLQLHRWSAADRAARVAELLEMVGLSDFADRHPDQLSGGMQQRVAIARALAEKPRLLLMDEPFGALDEITREAMNLELLRLWQETRKTVVFVTHSIAEAVFLSTHIVVMTARPGRIREVIEVDLPYPRTPETRETPRFFELTTQVREALRGVEHGVAQAPAAAQKTVGY